MTSSGVGLRTGLRSFEERDSAGTMPFQHWDFKPSQLHSRDKDPVPSADTKGLSSLQLCREWHPVPFTSPRGQGSCFTFLPPSLHSLSAPHPASYSNSCFLAVNTAPSSRAEIWIFFKGKSQSIPHLWPSCHFPWWPLLSRGLCFTKLHLRPSPLQGPNQASPSPSALPSCKRTEQNENWTDQVVAQWGESESSQIKQALSSIDLVAIKETYMWNRREIAQRNCQRSIH